MLRYYIITFFLGTIILTGCAGMELNTVTKTNQLAPGMTYDEVVQILGSSPKSSAFKGNKWIAKYSLHENWKGWIPYDFIFDKNTKRLLSWNVNEEEYQKSQQQMKLWEKALGGSTDATAGGVAAGPNDSSLQQWIAGEYFSFSSAGMSGGGTSRWLTLCPNGRFRDSSESGYSGGTGTDEAWGSVGTGAGGGTWTINGTQQKGTITLSSPQGESKSYGFSACGNGCFYFGNIKYGYSKPANCQ